MGILLSKTAQDKVESFGSEGERVCWVRLRGPMCCLFVIAVYMPHRGRIQPSQTDTIQDLEQVLKSVPRGDCVCVLGDFNEQLEANVQGRTGRFVSGPKSKNADKIMELMHLYDLVATNTFFQPAKGDSVDTFLRTEAKDENENDRGEYVGAEVATTYHGNKVKGKVEAIYGTPRDNDPNRLITY